MPLTVVQGKFGDQPVPGLADDLRRMADAVDRGEITDLICTFVEGDCYTYLWAASLMQSVGMSAMLHAQALDRMRE